ncbi:ribonucleoside-triphosphate reductase, adenosylcobalamin-dependent [Catellatospora sichuanensis]|uniref:ribonucleoside-triphosphate reductase, adenosylcobalamin-dependent n=1 Tax=Catellatospora sichuanensis TaxID=1969805 RepID=UPI0011825B19|nr:ribonucleoside-triphosphate reductase, adenosylcobalamin-dependent [Catellatospora sichuanensis]
MANFGPTGSIVFERTYSRPKPNGDRETWEETVKRVVDGNLSLVYGTQNEWPEEAFEEAAQLYGYMDDMAIIPAGRHLWASGIPGRQYLFNCHVSGWGAKLSDHFEFSFMRLMEGGGVGSNYSTRYIEKYGNPRRVLHVHIVCDPAHPDYQKMKAEGLISSEYSHEWAGAFPVEDSREGWAAALVDLVDTFMTPEEVKHSHRVYDVSRVRGEGQPLRTFGGTASGPGPLARLLIRTSVVMNYAKADGFTPLRAMEIDHEIGACVVAGGNRRSARMSMVRWDDPHVMEFIGCKSDTALHWTTNISVEIDNRFIRHLRQVRDGAPIIGERKRAYEVHKAVVTGMLENGEPGYWNSSLSNQGEPTEVICTNPCGEIALTEWENCNLGHISMDAFAPTVKGGQPDYAGLIEAHRLMARFLIRATYGDVTDPKQAAVLARQRRIGVGHFGVQGFLAKMGIKFSEASADRYFRDLLEECREAVREEARAYAFTLRIPEPVKVTTVAPTGSIAKLPGKTEGIHPVLFRHFIRRVRFSTVDPDQWSKVLEFAEQGYHVEPDLSAANTYVVEFPTKELLVEEVEKLGYPASIVETADEIPLDRMLAFQAMYQKHYADNAVSFTVNVPQGVYTVESVMDTLAEYLPSLKGTTMMPESSRPQAPYERITAEQWESATVKTVEDSVDEDCTNGSCPVR